MITIEALKSWLRIDFNDDDLTLQTCLDTAKEVIEEYTSHSLHAHTFEVESYGCDIKLYDYPITDIVADDEFKRYNKPDSILLSAPFGTKFVISVGVSDKKQLHSAVYQLASYYYENREPDHVRLPTSIQVTVNQLRRGLI